MKFKFTGQYTNGHESVKIFDTTFDGHEPVNVTDEAEIAKLETHPEVAKVTGPAKKTSDAE